MFLCLCFFAVLAMLPGPFSMREIVHNVYRQFPFYYFTEEKAQETWMENGWGKTLAEIEKRNGAYLEEVAENERNLREENAKKSRKPIWKKTAVFHEESKKNK